MKKLLLLTTLLMMSFSGAIYASATTSQEGQVVDPNCVVQNDAQRSEGKDTSEPVAEKKQNGTKVVIEAPETP